MKNYWQKIILTIFFEYKKDNYLKIIKQYLR